ncbi:MAG TPA: NAD(P)H-binding protein [Longimicrobium sp.]|nr:NAD(P)H-binding protein [Longimicrobium sp.]
MIIVTGATGQLGRAIVEQLVTRIPPEQVGASVRDPAKAADLEVLGVHVRRGDFADPASLADAFEGATQVLMVSSNAAAYGGDTLAQHRAAIDAARAAGARRIVYTSHMGASAASAFPPMRDHAATEAMLAESGVAWTALRNGFYASSGVGFLGDAGTTGVVEAPEDGAVSWTAHADLAAAAATILADEGRFDGPTPPLTGAESLDLAGLAAQVLGRPVRRHLLTDDELRARMAARGAPPRAADIVLGFYRASRGGEFAAVDPALEQLVGRPPIRLRDLAASHGDR